MKIDIDKLVCSFMEHCEAAMKCGGLTSKWGHDKFRFTNILLNEQGLEFRGGAIVPSGDGAERQGTCGDEGNGKILVPVCDCHGNVTGAVEYGDLLRAGAEAVAKAYACIQKQGKTSHILYNSSNIGKDEQKPAWSEEDEDVLEDVEEAIINYWHGQSQEDLLDWLKSLKERYTWKPSEEQMEALANALSLAKNCGEESAFDLRTLYEQLSKLRE